MTIYYVALSGNDASAVAGNPALPWRHVSAAVDLASDAGAGNIVEILDSGVYDEPGTDILGSAITLRATGSNAPTLDGGHSGSYAFNNYVSGNVFQGLRFQNYAVSPIQGSATAGYNFILSGCVAEYPGPQKIGKSGGGEIQASRLLATQHAAISIQGATGTGNSVWINNSFLGSNMPGYPVIQGYSGQGTVTASYCTVVGSGDNNSNGRQFQLIAGIYTVINCIVSGSGQGINARESSYNLAFTSDDEFVAWDAVNHRDGTARSLNTGEVIGDPLFHSGSSTGKVVGSVSGTINLWTQDYAVPRSSPAAEAGLTYQGVTTDISGNTRNATPTMGAYEAEAALWADTYGTETYPNFGSDFTINSYQNLTANYKLRRNDPLKQVPFFLGQPGPISLRKRKSYFATTGNPSELSSSS